MSDDPKMRAIASVLKEHLTAIADQFRRVDERLAALEARDMRYCGVWRKGDYQAGNWVSHAGGLWHANVATSETPGRSNAWTLAAKGATK